MERIHAKHRERMRRRFAERGLDGFADHEALELLLFYAIPRRNVNGTAHELLNRFGSLYRVFEADQAELAGVDGVGPASATLIKLVPELFRRYALSKTGSALTLDDLERIGGYLVNYYVGETREKVNVLLFDANLKMIENVTIHEGAATSSDVNPERIAEAVFSRRASAFILAHNHPGGSAEPSGSDLALTRRVFEAFMNFNITMREHVIVSDGEFRGILADSLDPGTEIL